VIEAPSKTGLVLGASLATLLLLAAVPATAHETKHGDHAEAAPATDQAGVELIDLELIDQDGQPRMFRGEVIGDRVVAITFIYTSCTTVCPVVTAIFGQVAQKLGDRLGKEVFLVSMSVDPATDRPARLRAYAEKYKAGEGWIWLTGNKLSMDKVLEGLGAYTPNYEDHPAMVLVGDGRTGEWTRFFGFPGPDKIVATMDALNAARAHAASTAAQN
jgi:protein SCO1/2